MTKSVHQLINFFQPVGYMLTIEARPGQREFKGVVYIYGIKKAEFVRLHAKNLKFDEVRVNTGLAQVRQLDNDEIELRPDKEVDLDAEYANELRERWGEDCDTAIAIGFSGKISETNMHGLYPCFYQQDSEQRELLATQFESHHAREVFPCVDEPAAKAKFLCRIDTDPGLEVLGNMPIQSENPYNEEVHPQGIPTKIVEFEMTPKMSPYLLAFVIGDLHRKTTKTKSGVEVNIYATPVQPSASLDFALDTAAKCIDFYDDYFGVPYPLPKSDHVALPDFSSGAMENWGLITYRETALLADENAGIASKQYIATVIAHELSHQWFGNLTTMQWWNDLWLNESFASLMEHIATDALFPDWNMWQTFETSDVIAALRRDSLPGVQAVQHDVQHPDEISTLFDSAIVYAKGERLLKMLRAFIGEDNFRAGLRDYFGQFAYKNTVAEDLWNCLAKVSGYDVAGLMNPWLTRPGYPVIEASVHGDEVALKQQRFFSDGTTDATTWPVPLFSPDESVPKIMEAASITFWPADLETFQLNVGNNAHFITAYDERLSRNLRAELATLAQVDRAKLLNEALLLTQPSVISTASIIDLLTAYGNEDNDAVWDMISMALGAIGRFVELGSEDEGRLRQLSGRLARKQYDRLGWRARLDESVNNQRLRPTILGQMIYSEDREAIDQALALYARSKHSLAEIAGDLRTIILGAAVRYGEAEEFDYLVTEYKLSQNAELKQDIAAALTLTRDQDRIDEMLDFLDKANIVKPQDLFYWYIWMLRNRHSRAKTWDWLVAHWDWIEQIFGGDKSYDSFPRYAGQILDKDSDLEKYQEFFGPKSRVPALKRAIEVGLSDIAARVAWVERDRTAVLAKLRATAIEDDNK